MTIDARRAPTGAPTYAATFVLGIEGAVTSDDYRVAVRRLQRALRPGDQVIPMDTRTLGVHCVSLSSARETEALATRLAGIVRAPMAFGGEPRTLGVCVGAATVQPDEPLAATLHRAAESMRRMRDARAGLLGADVPPQRSGRSVALPR